MGCMMSQNLDQKIASMTERQLRELIRKVLLDELEPFRGRFYSPDELITRNEFQVFVKLLDERHQSLLQLMNQRFEALQKEMNQRFEALQKEMNQRFEAQNQRFEVLQREMNHRFEAQNQRFEALQRSIDRNFKLTSLLITVFALLLSILTFIQKFIFP